MNSNKKKIVIVITIILLISGVSIGGFFIFRYLNPPEQGRDGPNINYIGPYIKVTHTCHYTHTESCSAELPNQFINYTVWSQDGSINTTNSVTTGTNGFFKLDLVVNKNWTIQMQTMINGTFYRGNTTFSTLSGSGNCITTGQLKQII